MPGKLRTTERRPPLWARALASRYFERYPSLCGELGPLEVHVAALARMLAGAAGVRTMRPRDRRAAS